MASNSEYNFMAWYIIPALLLLILEVIGIFFKYCIIKSPGEKYYGAATLGSIIFIFIFCIFVFSCINVDYFINCGSNINSGTSCSDTTTDNSYIYLRVIFWIFIILQLVGSGLFYFSLYRTICIAIYTLNFFILYGLIFFIIYYNILSAWLALLFGIWYTICVFVLWFRCSWNSEKYMKFINELNRFHGKENNTSEVLQVKEIEIFKENENKIGEGQTKRIMSLRHRLSELSKENKENELNINLENTELQDVSSPKLSVRGKKTFW
mgnify:CR=1 FL=1